MGFDQAIMGEATKQVFDDSRRTVVLYRATRTASNITGSEALTYGDAETVEVIFFKTAEKFEFGPEGLVEKGDCMVFDKPGNVKIARDDKIVADGETFVMDRIDQWRSRDEHIYDYAIGYLV